MKAGGAPCGAGRFKELGLREVLKIHKPRRKFGIAQLEPLWQRPVKGRCEQCRSFGASESCFYIFWQSASLVDGNLHNEGVHQFDAFFHIREFRLAYGSFEERRLSISDDDVVWIDLPLKNSSIID